MQACAACGHILPDRARFCASCGQATPNAQREVEKDLPRRSTTRLLLSEADPLQPRSHPTRWLPEAWHAASAPAPIGEAAAARSSHHEAETMKAPPLNLAALMHHAADTTTKPGPRLARKWFIGSREEQQSSRARGRRRYAFPWIVMLLIALFVPGVLIGAGTTIWAPVLTIREGTVIRAGTSIHLRGHNFIPDDSIALSIDDNIPLLYLQTGIKSSSNMVAIQKNGTFEVAIPIGTRLKPGYHTLHVKESFSLRSVNLIIIIKSTARRST